VHEPRAQTAHASECAHRAECLCQRAREEERRKDYVRPNTYSIRPPIEQLPCAARRFCQQSVTVDDDRWIAQAWSSKRPITWRSGANCCLRQWQSVPGEYATATKLSASRAIGHSSNLEGSGTLCHGIRSGPESFGVHHQAHTVVIRLCLMPCT